ncbi:hypothetical protein BOTBODRAFT_596145 [Botryobasidium botryosum FD-172 SS1]|uniref:Uncharacterized protein n=1 Tax=Botryobasidium botryosum (strain FD-172 SS1) TaxID=930990 RepID=A0A067LWX9_BOTB1|nr:hypothetical protein BOTBODRAFT_596145 [Botryobasidium botryosum FD-172 SS1]
MKKREGRTPLFPVELRDSLAQIVSLLPASNQAYRFMHVVASQDQRAGWEKAKLEDDGDGDDDDSGPLAILDMYHGKETMGRNGVLQGVLRAMAHQAQVGADKQP